MTTRFNVVKELNTRLTMRYLAIGLLKLYKATLSKIIGRHCIYTPTCSVYSMEAYANYNLLIASVMTLKRILRCAPWGKGGFDPVPANLNGNIKWCV